jgi:hypothetical protein
VGVTGTSAGVTGVSVGGGGIGVGISETNVGVAVRDGTGVAVGPAQAARVSVMNIRQLCFISGPPEEGWQQGDSCGEGERHLQFYRTLTGL